MVRKIAGLVLVFWLAVPSAFAQGFTVDEVLKRLDEKAGVFTSLQASVKKQHTSLGIKTPEESGTLAMTLSKGVPKVLLDIKQPTAMRYRLDNGNAIRYDVADNTYKEYKYDPKSEVLQFVVLGFGTRAEVITKGYKAQIMGTEMTAGVNAVILRLTSISESTDAFPLVTLWLDPQMWVPVQTRFGASEKSYDEFRYSDIRLNRNLPNSVFDLKMKSGAKKQ